jgi:hypothetical protein
MSQLINSLLTVKDIAALLALQIIQR